MPKIKGEGLGWLKKRFVFEIWQRCLLPKKEGKTHTRLLSMQFDLTLFVVPGLGIV